MHFQSPITTTLSKHTAVISHAKTAAVTILFVERPMVAFVILGLWLVVKIARQKVPAEFEAWR